MFNKNQRIKLSKTAWKKLRDYVQTRDGQCLVCGYKLSYAPAHVIGKGANGDDSPNNVIWLCSSTIGRKGCHEKYDQYEIELPESIGEMLKNEPEYL